MNNNLSNDFYTIFNQAYNAYLNKIEPTKFMNQMLEHIINKTNSSIGFIAILQDKNLTIEFYNQTNIQENIIIQKQIIIQDSIFYSNIIKTKKIQNINNYNFNNYNFNNYFLKIQNYSCICIPLLFNNNIIGIISLLKKEEYLENLEIYDIMGSLIGMLYNNYTNFSLIKLANKICLSTLNLNKNNFILSQQFLEEILNYTNSGIIITNETFDILYLNNYINIILNNLYDDLFSNNYINKNLINIFPQLSILNIQEDSCHKIYTNKSIELSIIDKSVEIILNFIINTIIFNNIYYNIIIIIQTEDCIKTQKTSNNYLIAYLSHELRNPLQSIILADYMLLSNIETFTDKMINYLKIIDNSGNSMKRIINDILDLSRIEANEFIIELEICNIVELLTNIIDEYSQANLTILLHIDENVPITVGTDLIRLNQIFNNLFSNAFKYSSNKDINLHVEYNSVNNYILFNIIDQGIGIKKEELCHLFKNYGKTSNNNLQKLDKINSNGLGLYISQKIANLLGGKITITSNYGSGSIFTLYHPIEITKSYYQKTQLSPSSNLSGNILLVDDDETNLSLLKLLLEQINYEYHNNIKINSINNGLEAINLCKILKYDIIFMDVNMDGIDGCSTSKIIKNDNLCDTIIAITGNILSMNNVYIDDKYKIFDEIVIKPYTNHNILKLLQKYLTKLSSKNFN
jgi:signal transduction histidine kinase